MKCTFKVAMNGDEKKAGNVDTITLDISFEGVSDEIIHKNALANRIVAYQSQIRSHWTEYKEGKMPTELKFDENLFATKSATVRPMTEDEMSDYVGKRIARMTPNQIAEFARTGRFPEGS